MKMLGQWEEVGTNSFHKWKDSLIDCGLYKSETECVRCGVCFWLDLRYACVSASTHVRACESSQRRIFN